MHLNHHNFMIQKQLIYQKIFPVFPDIFNLEINYFLILAVTTKYRDINNSSERYY